MFKGNAPDSSVQKGESPYNKSDYESMMIQKKDRPFLILMTAILLAAISRLVICAWWFTPEVIRR